MSSRVGAGHVAIFPVMTGFKKNVASEMKQAGSSGAKDFESSFKNVGQTAGGRLGRDLKGAFDSNVKGLGSSGLDTLKKEVATASGALSTAREKQRVAADKVTLAEKKLAEAISKHGEGSSQALAATQKLASAQREAARAEDGVHISSKRLTEAKDNLKKATDDAGNAAVGAKGKFHGFLDGLADKARSVGSSIKDALGKGLTKTADALRGPATAVVGGLATGVGVALTKGFSRLDAIDTAERKLRGLGHSGDATAAIMKNASAAVKGTAFGLGEAATTAAGAVAAGIKPGAELQSTLKGVANVAAATNRTMEDTGSIFNNVAANGKAYTQDIKQLANSGLPIWEKLGEVLGVTQDEVREMATNGEIDFETFSKAAQLAAGHVADELGGGVKGSISNFMASLGRIGANLLGGIYPLIAPLIQAVTTAFGPVEEIAEKLGTLLGEKVAPFVTGLTDKISKLGDSTGGLGGKFSGVASALGPFLGMILTLGSGGLGGLLTKIPVVGSSLGGLGGVFKFLGGPIGMVLGLLGGLLAVDPSKMTAGFESMSTKLSDALNKLLPEVINKFSELVPKIIDRLTSNLPVLINGIMSLAQSIIGAIVKVLPQIVTAVVQILPLLLTALVELAGSLTTSLVDLLPILLAAALQLFMGLVQAVIEVAPILIAAVLELLPVLIETLISFIPTLLNAAAELFLQIALAIGEALPQIIQSLMEILPSLLETIIGMIPSILESAVTVFLSLAEAVLIALPQLLMAIVGMLPQILSSIVGMLPQLLSAGVRLFTGLVTAVVNVLPALVSKLGEVKNRIFDFFSGAGQWLVSSGRSIIDGLKDGIMAAFQGVYDAVSDGLSWVRNLLPFSPAKEGPFSGRGYTTFSGRAMMNDLAGGISDKAPEVYSAAKSAMLLARKAINAGADAFGFSVDADVDDGPNRQSQEGPHPETGVVYNDYSTVVNPIAEPATTTKRKKAQRAAAGTEALI